MGAITTPKITCKISLLIHPHIGASINHFRSSIFPPVGFFIPIKKALYNFCSPYSNWQKRSNRIWHNRFWPAEHLSQYIWYVILILNTFCPSVGSEIRNVYMAFRLNTRSFPAKLMLQNQHKVYPSQSFKLMGFILFPCLPSMFNYLSLIHSNFFFISLLETKFWLII